jgi:hypothetical protein
MLVLSRRVAWNDWQRDYQRSEEGAADVILGPLVIRLSGEGVIDIDGDPQGADRAQAFGRLVRAIAETYPDALAANGYWHDGWPG